MPLDKFKRVRFKRSPLDGVICQLRFPTILKIDQNSPADFQALIEERFPYVDDGIDTKEPLELQFGAQEMPFSIAIGGIQQQRRAYSFLAKDNDFIVTLARNFLSLSTQKYAGWENFCSQVDFILKAFVQIYGKKELTRVGIRYVNAISKSRLGIPESTPWSDLIRPSLLGIICDSALGRYVKGLNSTFFLKDVDSSVDMQIISGIFLKTDRSLEQEVFLIDCDTFSTGKNHTDTAMSLLNRMHANPSSFLRQSITEYLYEIMEPEEIS